MKETIARGVSNGQLAYVGKTGSGRYHPFNFKRSITAFDVEISEEMFIITKETAEAYEKATTQPSLAPTPVPDLFPSDGSPVKPPKPPTGDTTPVSKPSGGRSGPEPTQLTLGLTWSGDVPSQKWMNFYTKVITKLGVGNDLSLNVRVKCKPPGGCRSRRLKRSRVRCVSWGWTTILKNSLVGRSRRIHAPTGILFRMPTLCGAKAMPPSIAPCRRDF